jgi:hypothetical protein
VRWDRSAHSLSLYVLVREFASCVRSQGPLQHPTHRHDTIAAGGAYCTHLLVSRLRSDGDGGDGGGSTCTADSHSSLCMLGVMQGAQCQSTHRLDTIAAGRANCAHHIVSRLRSDDVIRIFLLLCALAVARGHQSPLRQPSQWGRAESSVQAVHRILLLALSQRHQPLHLPAPCRCCRLQVQQCPWRGVQHADRHVRSQVARHPRSTRGAPQGGPVCAAGPRKWTRGPPPPPTKNKGRARRMGKRSNRG